MKWKRLLISIASLISGALPLVADDSISIEPPVSIEPLLPTKYERNLGRIKSNWETLIPSHFVMQNAGNMGVFSLGLGWSYGKSRQWELDAMLGYIPRHQSNRGKLTSTIKGNYIPWRICLNPHGDWVNKGRWNVEPFTVSLYVNTVYGHEFWKSQPARYPNKYYEFMSTKFRFNIAVGQRIMFHIPNHKRLFHNRVALFYEVSTCDLYIRSMFQTSIPLKDIIGLSIGLKLYAL